jgi:repressor LexA
MKALTSRQQEILAYIRSYAQSRGYWPSIREIQEHFQFQSTNAVAGHLRALESKGAIQRVPGQARTFRLLAAPHIVPVPDEAREVVELPVFGSIAAGYPDGVESGDAVGTIQVDLESAGRRGERVFALQVRGDSMVGAGIEDGDVVIVEPRPPRHNEIVAALIDGATTLKRYIARGGERPFLRAENPAYPDLIPADQLIIQGVAKSVVRRLA